MSTRMTRSRTGLISTTTPVLVPACVCRFRWFDNGFVKAINNNVALGLGIDWAHYGTHSNVVWVPVVMQWNFFLTEVVTVFGEPGIAIRAASGGNQTNWHADGVLQLGAKFMFSRNLGLTLRAGYPYFSLGLSLMF